MIRFGVHSHQAPAPFQLPFRTWDCNGAQSIADLSIVKSAVARYGDVLHTLGPATPTPEYITPWCRPACPRLSYGTSLTTFGLEYPAT